MNTLANIPQLRIDDENPDLSTVAQAGQSIAEAVDFMQQFRQNLYNFFPYRADALMELIEYLLNNWGKG